MSDYEKWQEFPAHRCTIDLYAGGAEASRDAERELRGLAEEFGAILNIHQVQSDPRYAGWAGWRTPVVCVDGREISHFSLATKRWRAALENAASIEPAKLVGEIVDLRCFLTSSPEEGKHAPCAKAGLEEGWPLGLAQEDGQLFVLLMDPAHEDAFESLKEHLQARVRVIGEIREKGGVQAVVVRAVEKAGA